MPHLSSQKLRDQLKRLCARTIYDRGFDYYKSRRVENISALRGSSKENVIISGEVSGSEIYETTLAFDIDKQIFTELGCSCPYEFSCKHTVSLGLVFIEMYEECVEDFLQFHREPEGQDLVDWIEVRGIPNRDVVYSMKRPRKIIKPIKETQPHHQSESLREMLRKTGAPIDQFSDEMLENLRQSFANMYQNGNFQNSVKSSKAKSRHRLSNYSIKLTTYYEDKFGLVLQHKSGYDGDPAVIIENTPDLTHDQKDLLALLKTLMKSNRYSPLPVSDYGRFFNLLKKADIPVYLDSYSHGYNDRKRVLFEVTPEKLKASLAHKERYNEYYDYTHHSFIFGLSLDYADDSNHFYYDDRHLLHLENNTLKLFEITPELSKIMRRIRQTAYNYEDGFNRPPRKEKRFDTQLLEDEVVNLNNIIRDAEQYLDLETDIDPNYEIREFEEAKPVIEVDYDANEKILRVKPIVDYGCHKIDVSETVFASIRGGRQSINRRQDFYHPGSRIMVFNGGKIHHAKIQEEIEKKLFSSLCSQDLGFSKTLKLKRQGNKDIFDFHRTYWMKLEALANQNNWEIRFIHDRLNFAEENFKANFNIDLDVSNDWLGFDVDCYCGKDQITIDDLRAFIEAGEDFITLKDGRLMQITNKEELARFVLMLESFKSREDGGFEGRLYHAPELEYIATSSEHYNAELKKSFAEFIKEAQSGAPVEKIKLPPKYSEVLRDYQKAGISWFYFLRKYRFAGILADDMGLGKTIQTLILLQLAKIAGKPSVVICPKTLLYNWKAEAEKFTPELKVLVIDGFPVERKKMVKEAKQYDLIIMGYATLQKDEELYKEQGIVFNYAVLDEAQFIKNYATKNAQVVKKINADYRLALTGTPLENSVSEIWSIFDFLMPGFLGSYKSFAKKFHEPIMKGGDSETLTALRKKIECFMLRRTKAEVLKELPPKVEQISHCHLGKDQNLLYQEILSRVKKEIFETVEEKGFNKSRIHILAGLTKLRQVCNHPVLLLKDKDYTKYESAKLEMFNELIEEVVENKKKVLVFSQFTEMLNILAEELKKKRIRYSFLSGKTKNRHELVTQFNEDPSLSVFLISLKAGGTGLNLTSADNVIIFDPWWNPSVESQAIDRTHRIGQKNSVNVYRLITFGTIEEKIVALQAKKKHLFNSLVGESRDLFQKLTWDDVKSLFK